VNAVSDFLPRTGIFLIIATFFASVSKFTKEVARAIGEYLRARRDTKFRQAESDLSYRRRMVQRHKNERGKFLLKRREKRSDIQEKLYQDSLSAARNQLYAERIQCMESWEFLDKHHMLPINPLTGKQWDKDDMDDFLSQSQTAEDEKIYA
jgi:hypothetical protein